MYTKKRFFMGLIVLLGLAFIAAACNMPSGKNDTSVKQTSVAETVAAALPTNTPIPTSTQAAAEPSGDDDTSDDASPTEDAGGGDSQTADDDDNDTDTDTDTGEDKAKFISDITIPDYTEYDAGEEITKTWRVQNVGTSTWTTDFSLVFMSGEQLGAPDKIQLDRDVEPNDFLDISVDFTVPSAGGEYRSDWIFEDSKGNQFGTGEDFQQSVYMIIVSTGDGSSGGDDDDDDSSGIAGGANVSSATVTVNDSNYSGSCPAQLEFTYTVRTSGAGKVNFLLELKANSPSGYKFDSPPEYTVDFTGGYTVTYTYTLFSNSSVNATATVKAIGSNTYTSSPINFSVNCN
ncbi:MAG TPA: NBR1-Ig-like domain-containing protein [Anaerolineales bacterium]|nr:NBR1-Ig-like domain-containing protein [Anaerolineales bacterium]